MRNSAIFHGTLLCCWSPNTSERRVAEGGCGQAWARWSCSCPPLSTPPTPSSAMLARLLSRARLVGLLRVPRVPPTLVARAMSSGGGTLGDAPSLAAAAAEDEAPVSSGDVLWQVRGIESHLPEPMWQALSRVNMSQGEINQLEVHEKIKRWQRFEGDTGSSEVVVGILSARVYADMYAPGPPSLLCVRATRTSLMRAVTCRRRGAACPRKPAGPTHCTYAVRLSLYVRRTPVRASSVSYVRVPWHSRRASRSMRDT